MTNLFLLKKHPKIREMQSEITLGRRGTPSVVKNKFERSIRSSILAAIDVTGFFAWHCDDGNYNRTKFHSAFVSKSLPEMNPYPFPRSILILDNAKYICTKNLLMPLLI
jgi:hypothetical protein